MAGAQQDRLAADRKVTCMVMNGAGKLRTLMDFPTIFKGEHVKKKTVHVMKGKEITVRFDRPVALQTCALTVRSPCRSTARRCLPSANTR